MIAVLEELIALHGAPQHLRGDNGPELTSLALTAWCDARNIHLRHIQPGKPSQNAFIERFGTSVPRRTRRRTGCGDSRCTRSPAAYLVV